MLELRISDVTDDVALNDLCSGIDPVLNAHLNIVTLGIKKKSDLISFVYVQ